MGFSIPGVIVVLGLLAAWAVKSATEGRRSEQTEEADQRAWDLFLSSIEVAKRSGFRLAGPVPSTRLTYARQDADFKTNIRGPIGDATLQMSIFKQNQVVKFNYLDIRGKDKFSSPIGGIYLEEDPEEALQTLTNLRQDWIKWLGIPEKEGAS